MISKINKNRTAIFMDSSNVYHSMKNIGWEIDWKKLIDYFSKEVNLINANFYMVEKKPLSEECVKLQSVLRKNGYKIKKKDLKEIYCSESNKKQYKGNMDIELAIDAIKSIETYDTCILFSGDGDFVPLVEYLEARNKVVKVISSIKKRTAIELIDAVGMNHISIESLRPYIERIAKKNRNSNSRVGFDMKSKHDLSEDNNSIKADNESIQIGDTIKTCIINSKDYGVFLKNEYGKKILLPVEQLGVDIYIPSVQDVFETDDMFFAKIIKVNDEANGKSYKASLVDSRMKRKIIGRQTMIEKKAV
jgi:uncharacterized LabA/DUF88 family protein